MKRNVKIFLGLTTIFAASFAGTYILERRKFMSKIDIPDFLGKKTNLGVMPPAGKKEFDKDPVIVEDNKERKRLVVDKSYGKSTIEFEALTNTIRTMSEDEQRIVLSVIPVELIFEHIESEFAKSQNFARDISNAMKLLMK